jgi:phosphoribosylformylglycinamidine cyclo-ligase
VTGPVDYRAAGVDIGAADNAKERMRALVESTFTAGTRGGFGGFGGMFRVPTDVPSPVLVASTDGVGTKIKLAVEARRHDTVGHDLVNHCVNDILVQGARPLFFLDYVAFGKLDPDVAEAVVRGVVAGCRENHCALLGGETAEMPGVYVPPDYDLAGFIVGYVDEKQVLGRERVREDDVLVALASNGLHTNGYSLARLIVADRLKLGVEDPFPDGEGTVADVLLKVHRSYLRPLSPALSVTHAIAHITGGGLPGNVSRALPDTLDAVIDTSSWTVPSDFRVLQRAGDVDEEEMFRTFNMGIGMMVITDARSADAVMSSARAAGVEAWLAGRVVRGSGTVILESRSGR